MMKNRRWWIGCAVLVSSALGCSDDAGPASAQGGQGGQAGGGRSGAGSSGGSTSDHAGNDSGGAAQAGKAGAAAGGRAAGGAATAGTNAGGVRSEAGAGGEGGVTDDPTPTVDCTSLPTAPQKTADVKGALAYHGIAFDDAGNLIGAHGGTVYKTALGEKPKVLAGGFGDVQGIDRFPSGDLAIVAMDDNGDGSLVRLTAAGAQDKLTDLSYDAYGVRVVPSGWVYVADGEQLVIVNATTKEKKTVSLPSTARAMDYSPDHQLLYVSTLTLGDDGEEEIPQPNPEEVGLVYVFDLDAAFLPKGKPRLFAQGVGGGWHDGLAVDACGNLFIPDYQTSALYRLTPDGKSALFQQWDQTTYGHSLAWGSGKGGWSTTSLYQPQPYNDDTVVEVAVGVPARR